jgi:hypothetical protein
MKLSALCTILSLGTDGILITPDNFVKLIPSIGFETVMGALVGIPKAEQMPFALPGLIELAGEEAMAEIYASVNATDTETFMGAFMMADSNVKAEILGRMLEAAKTNSPEGTAALFSFLSTTAGTEITADNFLSLRNDDGLIPMWEGRPPYWNFYEWSQGMDGSMTQLPLSCREEAAEVRVDAPMNCFAVLAFDRLAKILKVLGENCSRYEQAADSLRKAAHTRFWNEAEGYYYMPATGVYVMSADASNAKGKFFVGDVVLAVNGLAVSDTTDLIKSVNRYPAGTTVDVTVWRDGAKTTVQVILSEGEIT